MSLDPSLLREAEEVMRLYSSPAQAMIKLNLYGPREARFAGAIVEKRFTVEVHHEPTETELLKSRAKDAWTMIDRLCKLLAKTTTIIEERVAMDVSMRTLLDDCESAALTAEEDFEVVPEEKT